LYVKKYCAKKRPPNWRKFAQSGHPGYKAFGLTKKILDHEIGS
jgi:hypothetical protein